MENKFYWLLIIGVIVGLICFSFIIGLFMKNDISITTQECHKEISYDRTEETYYIHKIAEMGELIESTKIDYLFNKCNFPIGVQDYIINYSNTDITKDMLNLQRHECARFLVTIRDYNQFKDILSDKLDSLYVLKEVCNKTEVNKIIYSDKNSWFCEEDFYYVVRLYCGSDSSVSLFKECENKYRKKYCYHDKNLIISKSDLDISWLNNNCECIGCATYEPFNKTICSQCPKYKYYNNYEVELK